MNKIKRRGGRTEAPTSGCKSVIWRGEVNIGDEMFQADGDDDLKKIKVRRTEIQPKGD